MEMHQVRYFVALCEELNFTRAAKRCDVAQASLSNAIKALEAEMQGALFHRFPMPHLTELGELVRPLLQNIDRDAQDAKRRAASFNMRKELSTARTVFADCEREHTNVVRLRHSTREPRRSSNARRSFFGRRTDTGAI